VTTALVLGKFLPPHAGHVFLAERAHELADEVIVLVLAHPDEPIPVDLRHRWLEELLPRATVRSAVADHPVDYGDDGLYDVWAATIREAIGRPTVDLLVTSEPAYGDRMAARLGARHVLVDPDRRAVPISATAIREDPWANWRYLGPGARAWYARRVCLMGAESTGKTTLAEALARVYDTVWVPEYGRPYTVSKNKTGEPWTTEDFIRIARRQQADEDEAARLANRILFCDTDALTTAIWHERYLGRPSPEVEAIAAAGHYDLTFLMGTDVPWIKDKIRNSREVREQMQQRFREVLRNRPEPVLELRGPLDERTATAIEAIDQHLGLRPPA
jgi:HTH-type transcriptional repressor of NAD biosynthesis genes